MARGTLHCFYWGMDRIRAGDAQWRSLPPQGVQADSHLGQLWPHAQAGPAVMADGEVSWHEEDVWIFKHPKRDDHS